MTDDGVTMMDDLPADLERWRKARDAIYRRIMDRGWSPTLKAFVHTKAPTSSTRPFC
jgi:hypothetical protein